MEVSAWELLPPNPVMDDAQNKGKQWLAHALKPHTAVDHIVKKIWEAEVREVFLWGIRDVNEEVGSGKQSLPSLSFWEPSLHTHWALLSSRAEGLVQSISHRYAPIKEQYMSIELSWFMWQQITSSEHCKQENFESRSGYRANLCSSESSLLSFMEDDYSKQIEGDIELVPERWWENREIPHSLS